MSEQDFCRNNQNECECGHDHDYDEDVIYLTLDDDTELKCNVVGTFEVDDKDYIALLPEGEEQVLLYNYSEDDEGIEIINIDDDDEFDKVSDAFMNEFADEIDIIDDEYDYDTDEEDD